MSNIPTRESVNRMGKRLYKPLPYPGFGHYDVSDDGIVMKHSTGKELKSSYPSDASPIKWVSLTPDPSTGYKPITISVARLVYEAHKCRILPKGTQIKFKDQSKDKYGHYLNYHVDNLYVEGDAGHGGPVQIFNLPVVRPESSKPATPVVAPLSERERRAIDRYNKMIDSARDLVLHSDAMLTVADIDALNLQEADYIDVLEGMSIEQTAAFMRRIIQMAREAGKED